ncbi:MAG TPA: alkyl hydroperoxide reductase subunit F [Selenomonadales bacterium]|nr:alkyl hydroperoxide reductase subunit F [Selenomonadales bacterium]
MLLDQGIKEQLSQYLQLMEGDVLIKVSAGGDDVSRDMLALVEELASLSPRIAAEKTELPRTPSFSLHRAGADSGITFAGIPLGHEFNSLVLALLQVSGRAPKAEQKTIDQVKALQGQYHFESFISLSCHICPEVVQALNLMSVLNPGITHTMVDGGAFQEEVQARDILAVPAVYLNGEFFSGGRTSVEEILGKLGAGSDGAEWEAKEPFDILVVGGGPAGASAAIYAARKGIRTGLVLDRFGGQVKDTLGIENFISMKYTEGPKLAADLEEHIREYPIDVMKLQRGRRLAKKELIELELENGAVLRSKAVILATGARWRNIGVPGEAEFKNKGVAYCPHCDGPVFKGKRVAVIGGGNSGIEAAIDLAGIVEHVTVLEFLPELKADVVLQQRLYSLPNVTVLKNVQTKEITGTDKVDGLSYIDRGTGETRRLDLQGVFVLIGLVPNTDWLGDAVERNRCGEILVDGRGATNVPGVFAAGDCTNSPFKQIIIAMGSGANAALGAFDYLIRN